MRALPLLALLPCLAVAQTSAVGTTDPSRGVNLLPGSVAWSDEATSLVYNPAALGRVGRLNGWLLHEHSNTRRMENTGLWVATSFGDLVGLGVSLTWLNSAVNTAIPPTSKGSLGFSVGPKQLSAGVAVNWFSGGLLSGLATIDLGLQTRPFRWLAAGAFVRNLSSGTGANLREWTLGIGIRPGTERVSLGVDWVVNEVSPVASSRLQYTVTAQVIDGVRLLAGFTHAFDGSSPMYVHAGLGLDLENFGYTQGFSAEVRAGADVNAQFAARFSLDAHDSLIPERKIAVLSLAGISGPPASTLGSLLGIKEEDRYLRVLRALDRAATDSELAGVVLKVEDSDVGLARATEVRAAILKLRRAGKKVFAYVLNATDIEYLMVSACDGLYAAPEAMFLVDGLRSQTTFFGGAAQKLGITVDVARAGEYKNFPDQFTRTGMSDEQRESIEGYLDTNTRVIAAHIKTSRGLDEEAWQAGLDEGLKSVRRAVELKQLDGVMTPQQFDEFLGKELPGARVDPGYSPWPERDLRWGRRDRIAVIPVLGNISGGSNSNMPLLGETAGAASFQRALSEAVRDADVKAIVLRIDSPGGDGLASDMMYRAVLEAKKRKPVIASMGDVAASGGYYVAMGADVVVASPTTITGSIGVFYVKPALKGLAEEYGVTQETIRRGKLAGVTDLYEPWTDEQRAAAQGWIDEFYDTFITEAATSRKMTKEAMHEVARGRVWSGEDALAKGLVDVAGGFIDAVQLAKERGGITHDDYTVAIADTQTSVLGSLVGATLPNVLLNVPVEQPGLPPGLSLLAKQLGSAAWLLEKPGVQARLEYGIEVR